MISSRGKIKVSWNNHSFIGHLWSVPHFLGMGLDALNTEMSKTVGADNSRSWNTYYLTGGGMITFYLSLHVLFIITLC